ncbi:MAG: histidine--tRNA ligase [Planctomycetota bacterium]|jgi:histidyl-tRNA synthetase|nr:histidine--tRNA ligase [Planctomycetota bacterium]
MPQPRFRAIEGTRDYFDREGERFDRVLARAGEMFPRYGYARFRTPIFEDSELFARSLGDATDIVEKEMYTFQPGSDSLTLRPEGTAGIVRAYLQHGLDKRGGLVKLWYAGPMFRRERPQKGRQRQFHQVGVEAIGSGDPLLDAEVISLGLRFYESLGVAGVGLRLNSIGCRKPECRPRYRLILREAIQPRLGTFCRNCQARFERNVFRLLDCKVPQCRELARELPKSHENLCPECAEHFAAVRQAVEALGGSFSLDSDLVRGLDYYSRTVFEYTHESLGAQNALGGGGRYDGLAEELGGPPVPAIGFALGVERILIALEAGGACGCPPPLQAFGASRGEAARRAMAGLIARLREAGFSADLDYDDRSLKSQLRLANRRGALCCLILGEEELGRGEVIVKDMREGRGQAAASLFDCLGKVREILSC